MNQRLQKENDNYEALVEKYVKEIQNLVVKKGKSRKIEKRCKECYFVLEKKEAENC